MSETTRWLVEVITPAERAEELAREIRRTGFARVGSEKFYVNQVLVFENRGIVSGWNIVIDGEPGSFNYVLRDRGDSTYMTIFMKKPGVLLAVGTHPRDGSRAVIIYRNE